MLGASKSDFERWPFGGRPPTPCVYPGCTELVPGGYRYCMPHLLAFEPKLKRMEASTMTKDKTTCIEPGCNEPRLLNKNGVPYSRCETHQKATWNNRDQARGRIKTPKASPATPALEQPAPQPLPAVTTPAAELVATGTVEAESPQAAIAQVAETIIPSRLEQVVRDAIASQPDAVRVSVTRVKITFSGEIEINL